MHYRIFETDGVSLEMEKWAKVLENQGHKVYFIGGNETEDHLWLPSLNYIDEATKELNRSCYETLGNYSEIGLEEEILRRSQEFSKEMIDLIKTYKIDTIIPNNIFSLGIHLHCAIGLYKAIEVTGIKVIGHHHDFYFEREYYGHPTTKFVARTLEQYYPPTTYEAMKHVVINSSAKDHLKARLGISGTVVPNVFDFEMPQWQVDDFNKDFRRSLGIKEEDIVLLQATRVTNRKAIELAIDVVARMNQTLYRRKLMATLLYDGRKFTEESKIILLLVGLHEGLDDYENKLIAHAQELGIEMLMNPEVVGNERGIVEGSKMYSLWDAYTSCDFITYPSIFEGWGNQFLEAVFAKKPLLIFDYSVYQSDIKPGGFDVISLGDRYDVSGKGLVKVPQGIVDKAGGEIIQLLTNQKKYKQVVESNFSKGKKFFSYDVLGELLVELLK